MVGRTLEEVIELEFDKQDNFELDYRPNQEDLWKAIREDNGECEYTKYNNRWRRKYE